MRLACCWWVAKRTRKKFAPLREGRKTCENKIRYAFRLQEPEMAGMGRNSEKSPGVAGRLLAHLRKWKIIFSHCCHRHTQTPTRRTADRPNGIGISPVSTFSSLRRTDSFASLESEVGLDCLIGGYRFSRASISHPQPHTEGRVVRYYLSLFAF